MNAVQPALLALPNYSAISFLADLPADEHQDALWNAGWEELGGGIYCTAWLSPCGSRIAKLGSGYGSRTTLKVAQEHPDNPHLPTVYGVFDLDGYEGGNFIAECEVLEHLDDYDPNGDPGACETWQRWSDSYRGGVSCGGGPDLAAAPEGPMKDAFAALAEAQPPEARWDCHDGNVMLRPSDGALVLNDLLA